MKKYLIPFLIAASAVWSVSLMASIISDESPHYVNMAVSSESTEEHSNSVIRVALGDEVIEMLLDEYLTGVLLQEIPADFHFEAKKAQAVVARTYALRVAEMGVKHGPGTVCANSGCCQAYIRPEEYARKWGVSEPVEQAKNAVRQTEGMVLCYEGALIDATYFSCSGGMTEDALAVWGADVPYLQSVESPGEENANGYIASVKFTAKEFCKAIGRNLEGYPANWFGEVSRTKGGGVESIQIAGQYYSGTELRSCLGLRSTNFTIAATTDSIVITTKGYGHRVGMSQYGADAMARSGSDFSQILEHYYEGVTLAMDGQ